MPKNFSAPFLPITSDEIKRLNWEQLDVIIVSGDAYVDHPSFGAAVIGRIIENEGYKVAIISQPNWKDDLRDFKKFGVPKLFFGVTSGCMDSMVNHYTANKRLRSDDAYTAGGKSGFRPDYAVNVYTKILKQLYPDVPVVIGGIEASLRRMTHYDYWSNSLMPSILKSSGADLLIYGMGEEPIIELLKKLDYNIDNFKYLKNIPQTAYINKGNISLNSIKNYTELPSYEQCLVDKKSFAKMFVLAETESNKMVQNVIIQKIGNDFLVINPAYPPAKENIADLPYDLPYSRLPHPKYLKRGVVPAYEMIKHSVNSHRGCFGGCSFCAITSHQGKFVSSRSEKSILNEVKIIANSAGFKGTITDVGGPSANMYKMSGKNIDMCKTCKRPSCIYPNICKNLNYNHKPLLDLYDKILNISGIKHVFIGSGIRHDMLVNQLPEQDKKYALSEYLEKLIVKHISGRFKVAPEHTSQNVLKYMRKPDFKNFKELLKKFNVITRKNNLKMQIVPYLISGHPGCGIREMAELAFEMKEIGLSPEQVQSFTPTPMTLSSVMFYCGFDPYTNKNIYIAKNINEKKEQHKFFFWYLKENKQQLVNTLYKTGNFDLKKKLFPNNKYNF